MSSVYPDDMQEPKVTVVRLPKKGLEIKDDKGKVIFRDCRFNCYTLGELKDANPEAIFEEE